MVAVIEDKKKKAVCISWQGYISDRSPGDTAEFLFKHTAASCISFES